MTPPVRLLLARHGQTEWHRDNRYVSRTDIRLTDTGREQARSLARRAEREGVDLVLCSPLTRALETAKPAAVVLGLEPETDERLRELDFGGDDPMSVGKILVAGDRHILSSLMVEALKQEMGDDLDVATVDFDWPMEPHKRVAEVNEAAGSEEEMIEAGEGAEVIVTQLAPLTEKVLSSLGVLKLVVVTRGGPVNVNIDAASENGVAVCYAPGRNAPAAAEYALGLMLAAMKRIPDAHASLSNGEWRGEFYAYEENGIELDGATVGLVGFGAIGSRVAQVLQAFGSEVLVYDPFVDDAQVGEAGGRKAELNELLESSKVVSLHARLTDETRGMIGAEQIARMPEGTVLVNTARGGLLDHDALCDALESRHLKAAALDVYDVEPPSEGSRLFEVPNLVLSPHIAGATKETAHRAARIAAEEVGRYARGEDLLNVANRDAVTR